MRAAIYLRVSTEDQDEENQLSPCEKLCLDRGWSVFDIYRERVSAWGAESLSKRPELTKLLKDARQKKVAHVVIWDLDRLFRNRVKLVETIRAYAGYGVRFHSVRQSWLDELNKAPPPWNEIMTDLMLQIIGWMGEDESNKRSERTKAGIARKKKLKEYGGGRPSILKKKGIDPAEICYRREAGMSFRKLAAHFKVSRTTIMRVTKKSSARLIKKSKKKQSPTKER